MTTTLYLIRHAETMWNREGRMQGFGDSPLSELGTQQAEALARRMPELKIDAFYSSDAPRCLRTMRIATGSLNARVAQMPELRERHMGDWEGKLWTEISGEDPEGARLYKTTAEYRPPHGESLLELRNRITRALVEISAANPGRRSAIFTSGGSIRAAVFGLLDIPCDAWAKLSAWNTGITRFDLRDAHWKLTSFNDTTHLSFKI